MASLGLRVVYCASCNYLPRALWMAGEVLSEIQHEVSSFTLVPGDRGIFDWFVDDECVYSHGEMGRFPDLEEIKEAIYAHLDT